MTEEDSIQRCISLAPDFGHLFPTTFHPCMFVLSDQCFRGTLWNDINNYAAQSLKYQSLSLEKKKIHYLLTCIAGFIFLIVIQNEAIFQKDKL